MNSVEKLEHISESIGREADDLNDLIDTFEDFLSSVKVSKQNNFINMLKQLKSIKSNVETYADNLYCAFEDIAANEKPKAD